MEDVTLHGNWGSPFGKRVEMGLNIKGVKYELIDEDLGNKSPLLLKYNPVHKKVPVLVHNGKPIAESLVILEYIDETWEGPSILPKDPYERAQARFWAKFIDEKCIPALFKACFGMGEEREKAKEEATELLKFLENEIRGKKFFGGDDIGLIDIAANFIGYWFGIITDIVGLELITKEKYPNLCKWIDEYNDCNFVKENLAPKDRLVEYYKGLIQATTGSK